MKTITLATSGTHCPSCSMLIEMTLCDLPGVTEAKADHPTATAVVTYDPSVLDESAIEEAIRGVGYGAELVA